MGTLRQLLREFWLPALIASAWTAYALWEGGAFSIANLLAAFSTSFFLAAWATGQVVRVQRQARTEGSLSKLETRLLTLADDLAATAVNLEGAVTGGDSFCWVSIMKDEGQATGLPCFVHEGNFPLSGIQATLAYDAEFNAAAAAGMAHLAERHLDIGDLTPNTSRLRRDVPLAVDADLHIRFGARNGLWHQVIKVRDGMTAFAVLRGRFHPAEVLKFHLPEGFPLIGDDLFDVRLRQLPTSGGPSEQGKEVRE